jgi:hypothetical protein
MGMKSVSTIVPESVSKVVRSTFVRVTYSWLDSNAPLGRMAK